MDCGATSRRIDVLGALLVTAATGTLIWTVITAGEHGAWTWTNLLTVLVSVGLYAAFVLRQRRAATPLVNMELLARRPVVVGIFLIFMATALMIAVFFLGSFYFQQYLGYNPILTGLLFLPVAIATMAGANAAGRLIAKLGLRALGATGLLVAAAGLALAGLLLQPGRGRDRRRDRRRRHRRAVRGRFSHRSGERRTRGGRRGLGVVSTFHEFGASAGAAVMSSVAAVSLTGGTTSGFTAALVVAAGAAVVAAVITTIITPRTTT